MCSLFGDRTRGARSIHGEDVDEAYRHVKGRVTHAHYRMLPQVERQMELLWDEGFEGHFSLEINPESEEASDIEMAKEAAAWKAVYQRLSEGGRA